MGVRDIRDMTRSSFLALSLPQLAQGLRDGTILLNRWAIPMEERPWRLVDCFSHPALPEPLIRAFACDCIEHALFLHGLEGREPAQQTWDILLMIRRYAHGVVDAQKLGDAKFDAIYLRDGLSRGPLLHVYQAIARAAHQASIRKGARDATWHAVLSLCEEEWQGHKPAELWRWQALHLASMIELLLARQPLLSLFQERSKELHQIVDLLRDEREAALFM